MTSDKLPDVSDAIVRRGADVYKSSSSSTSGPASAIERVSFGGAGRTRGTVLLLSMKKDKARQSSYIPRSISKIQ